MEKCMTCGRDVEEKTISCLECVPLEDLMEKCNICGETVDNACTETVCETEVPMPKIESIHDVVKRKILNYFCIDEVESEFIDDIISTTIKMDQIGRMGAILDVTNFNIEEIKNIGNK